MSEPQAASGVTWSGIPLKTSYGPAQPDASYKEKLGAPGEMPFTRAGHAQMYRKRLWITRQLAGLDTAAATNQRLRYLVANGQTGLAVVPDTPTQLGLDSDHPLGERSVGTQGVPLCTVQDMDQMLDGVDLTNITASFSVPGPSVPVLLAQLLAVADRRGVPWDKLRGSFQNDPLQATHTCYDPGTPLELGMRLCVDTMEHCARHVPGFHPTTVNAYDLRESGLNAAEEIGVAIAMARAYLEETLKRGVSIDQVGPGVLLICSAHIDLFEEVAKFRAARRIWSRMMRDHFGAKEERTCRLTLAVHTAGSSLFAPQPVNNVVRGTIEALAAVLGGCQGLDLSAYDEPVDLPSEQAGMVALRTQQIIALESGAANVVDPLGGSWFVEELTDEVERRALAVIDEIDKLGGMVAAAKAGWLRNLMDERQWALQKSIESGERPIVGVNCYQIAPEKDTLLSFRGEHPEPCREQVDIVRAFRQGRNAAATRAALAALTVVAKDTSQNLIIPIKTAVEAGATMGEVMGTIRQAYGLSYDPLNAIQAGTTI